MMIAALLCLVAASFNVAAAHDKSPQEKYIDKFAPLAVEEMYRSGIPASITLAQGLLESGYGLSELAVKGNNHFGIKCHNTWTGKKMYYDDDKKGECFRVYSSPEQSYRDHSDFLRYRDRYKFLFDYKITDYKSWAHGLKKAGYATDPSYPKKLINLIEEYDLHEYDKKSASYARKAKKEAKQAESEKPEKSAPAKPEKTEPAKPSQPEKVKVEKEKKVKDSQEEQIPQGPLQIEQDQTTGLTDEQRSEFRFSASREVFSKNGVPFVYSVDGETYESIAASNNLFVREILKYNDADRSESLKPGTVVYLKPKKKQTVKGLDKHVVESGESLRAIAQRYGVTLKSLYKMNVLTEQDVLRPGDIIKLRKK